MSLQITAFLGLATARLPRTGPLVHELSKTGYELRLVRIVHAKLAFAKATAAKRRKESKGAKSILSVFA